MLLLLAPTLLLLGAGAGELVFAEDAAPDEPRASELLDRAALERLFLSPLADDRQHAEDVAVSGAEAVRPPRQPR